MFEVIVVLGFVLLALGFGWFAAYRSDQPVDPSGIARDLARTPRPDHLSIEDASSGPQWVRDGRYDHHTNFVFIRTPGETDVKETVTIQWETIHHFLRRIVGEDKRLVRIDIHCADASKTLERSLGDALFVPEKSYRGTEYSYTYSGTVLEGPGKGEQQEWTLTFYR